MELWSCFPGIEPPDEDRCRKTHEAFQCKVHLSSMNPNHRKSDNIPLECQYTVRAEDIYHLYFMVQLPGAGRSAALRRERSGQFEQNCLPFTDGKDTTAQYSDAGRVMLPDRRNLGNWQNRHHGFAALHRKPDFVPPNVTAGNYAE